MSDENATPGETEAVGGSVVEQVRTRWTAMMGEESTVILLTVVAVALFPYLFARAPIISDFFMGYQALAGLILIWGLFALGFDLLLGRVGLLSFGHAALWGAGAYGAGWLIVNVTSAPIVALIVGALVAVLFSWVLGWLSLRRGGIYFAILTLAFAQMLYYIAAAPAESITGGRNGLTGVTPSALFGVFDLSVAPPSVAGMLFGTWLYVLIGAVLVLSVAAILRILNSPYGTVFRAIRENEQRAEFVGLNTWRYKLMGFILSGTFAGIAGALFAIHGQYVPLNSLYWTTSGEIVIMTVIGGVGSLFGPLFGAGLYLSIRYIVGGIDQLVVPFTDIVLISDFGVYWHVVLGLVFVLVVVFLPEGLWGGVKNFGRWLTSKLGGER